MTSSEVAPSKSALELLQSTWAMIQRHAPGLVFSIIFTMGFGCIVSSVALLNVVHYTHAPQDNLQQTLIMVLVEYVISLLFQPGFIRYAVRMTYQLGNWSDIYLAFDKLPAYFVATCLYAVVVGLASLCLLVPGIYVGSLLSLYGFAIVEEGLGPLAALRRSAQLARKRILLIIPMQLLLWIAVGITSMISLQWTLVLSLFILPYFVFLAQIYDDATETFPALEKSH